MAFMPHLSYAKMAIQGDWIVSECLKAARPVNIPHSVPVTRACTRWIFGGDLLGCDELLSDPDRKYGCMTALCSFLDSLPEGRKAVVAVRTEEYAEYLMSVLPEKVCVETFYRLLQTWDEDVLMIFPMGVSTICTDGYAMKRKLSQHGRHKSVLFEPSDRVVSEMASNTLHLTAHGLKETCRRICADLYKTATGKF
ncbi:hypothetical protein [European catfish virus]|uniref:Uncharacterized protein n=1 Tax=European catfish virus TaxID=84739 RepID=I2BFU3_9VIRU|nr:hypothetical protein A190_gp113 [European catfish virus]AFJ52396.1 hypothetical protein [European catfish virus]AMZ04942.1 hypothetical protein [European catfish virus]AMZ05078.1 hypothetical protein [European catfish virus]